MQNHWPQIIAHADMDAFYAAVEQLDNPHLRGKPLVVGPRSQRGVVLTASYEARKYGVKSAMPMAEALRRCPHVLTVPPRFDRYQQQSRAIMAAFKNFSPQVEALSLDEAFIEMTGAEHIFGPPMKMARQIREAVYHATGGLSASVGIACTKYVAKVASDYKKPNGITIVPPEYAVQWLDPMPVERLWGAGPKTVPKLQRLGLYTIGDVRRAETDFLHQHLGNSGLHFHALAHAQDPRRVACGRRARSVSSDRTLTHNTTDRDQIERHLRRSADRIGRRLRSVERLARGVQVRLKTPNFQVLTHQSRLPQATNSTDKLFSLAVSLLDQFDCRREYRLVGMAAYDLACLSDPVQLSLFDTPEHKPQALQQTLDHLAEKFGQNTILRARDLQSTNTLTNTAPTMDDMGHCRKVF